jgi:putative ABC transport system permease protein
MLKTFLRRLQKHKGFTLLNVFGLTLGLATTLLIVFYVVDELGYDRYNLNAGRIFRVQEDLKVNHRWTAFADAAPPVAGILKTNYPEVAETVRILPEEGVRFKKGNEEVEEPRVARVDPTIFKVFTLPMIEGDPTTALSSPNSIVLSESMATKYFGTTQVIGRSLYRINDTSLYLITGIIRDMPVRSSFNYDIFMSLVGNHEVGENTSFYAIYRMSTFILLKPGASIASVDQKLGSFMNTWDKNYSEFDSSFAINLSSMPLTAIHLHSNRSDELSANGSIQYVYIFSAIALFVLLIASINFMNLSTAQSVNRAREVGVRKVLGSDRGQLVRRFLSESMLLTGTAAICAIILAIVLLPLFNRLTGKELAITGSLLLWLAPILLGVTLLVGALSGAYPAVFLSSFKPVEVLKGKLAMGGRGAGLRSVLVVFQFAISVFLIVGTLVVYNQLQYIQHRDVGFDRDQVLIVKGLSSVPHPFTLKKEVQALPGVADVTLSNFMPTGSHRWHNWGSSEKVIGLETQLWEVDESYISTMGMHLASGRNFEEGMATDSTGIIVNETAARLYQLGEQPLGKDIFYQGFWKPTHFHVIGVVRDFNYSSVRSTIAPLVMVLHQEDDASLAIRVRPGNIEKVIQQVKAQYAALAPQRQFDYSFMDEDFDTLYHAERRMARITIVLTSLALIIACLGLFGLAAYAAEQRMREIGIRKVLGASVPGIVALLGKEFMRLIAVAIVIASPLAWLTMDRWLENFAYRTTIGWWVFAAAAAMVLVIASLTTLFQSVKAATVNPIDSLRAE